MTDDSSEQQRWFREQLEPHESKLRAWLRSRFPSELDVDDIIQESYLKVLRAKEGVVMENPKAFWFATARNLALDHVRHPRLARTEHMDREEYLEFEDNSLSVPETVSRNQELEILTRAVQSLPKRCRQVVTLAKIYGLSQREVARKLGISENTVSNQLTIGVRKCVDFAVVYRGGKGCI
ncbi:RNA polymerase sigma factor [Pelagicoccus sp. NFK12]|uniref:RNA polymerase sigma factor n=1 Tax=Pelagicoccus enzymogenes TaxID=2773457 RepID=A0A927IGW5_9BACT|nr:MULTISPECIES: RNA polymerase sigma factor [Pelagicoccus]MBD5781617.1 RNA polymerase sigma factor [Pelagicoccus enzymogenes]MDQ8181137.1 RNA polymerase sigma factor [Pelagicoccus sp. SDUM812005]